MSILPPHDFVSTAMATVYTIAHIAMIETNTGEDRDLRSYFYGRSLAHRGISASWFEPDGLKSTQMRVSEISLTRHDEYPDNPFMPGGVGLLMNTWAGERIPLPGLMDGCDTDELFVTISPPYKDCLKPARISSFTAVLDAENFQQRVGNIEIRSANVETMIANYTRQVFAEGKAETFLLTEDGEFKKIPPHFWRSEKAEKAMLFEHPMSVRLDDGLFIGSVLVNLKDIRDLWSNAYKKSDREKSEAKEVPQIAAASKALPQSVVQPSPFLAFMLEVSSKLGLVNGRCPDGTRLKIGVVEATIADAWHSALGEPTPSRIRTMATLIRHPDDGRGGNFKAICTPVRLSPSGQSSEPENADTAEG